jgi:hypothetical protein
VSDVVFDCNVVGAANGLATHATPRCQLSAIDRLKRAQDAELIVLDEGRLIIEALRGMANPYDRQPRAGDLFVRWLWEVQANPLHARTVRITPHGQRGFEEFPDEAMLEGFDADDRMYVAAAVAAGNTASIVNAVDTDWWDFRDAFSRVGINIEFLCPDEMLRRHQR